MFTSISSRFSDRIAFDKIQNFIISKQWKRKLKLVMKRSLVVNYHEFICKFYDSSFMQSAKHDGICRTHVVVCVTSVLKTLTHFRFLSSAVVSEYLITTKLADVSISKLYFATQWCLSWCLKSRMSYFSVSSNNFMKPKISYFLFHPKHTKPSSWINL